MSPEDFLRTSYTLMIRKLNKIKNIDDQKVRGKLPLPLLKEQGELASSLLEGIRQMINLIDYEADVAREVADLLNEVGRLLGLSMVLKDPEALDSALRLLREAVGRPTSILGNLEQELDFQKT